MMKTPFIDIVRDATLSDQQKIEELSHKALLGISNLNERDDVEANLLHEATFNGGPQLFEWLCQYGPADLVHATTKYKTNVLFYAAKYKNRTMIEYLINKYPELIKATNANNYTCLAFAAFGEDIEIFKRLEQARDDSTIIVNQQPESILTFMEEIVGSIFDLQTFEFFLKKLNCLWNETWSGYSLVHLAAKKGNLTLLKYLIIEQKFSVEMKSNNGKAFTPLQLAAQNGHYSICDFLIQHGAHYDELTPTGFHPIHLAAYYGHDNTVLFFLSKGVNLNLLTNEFESNLLHLASQQGHLSLVKLLISLGLNYNKPEKKGFYPCHLASNSGHTAVVEYFIQEKKFDVNTLADNNQLTCLHLATRHGHLNTVKRLIELNALYNMPDNNGYYPIHLAAQQGHTSLVKFFVVEKKINVDYLTNGGFTALHIAAMHNRVATVKVLFEELHAVHKNAHYNDTPFMLAVSHGCLDVVKYFVETKIVTDQDLKNIRYEAGKSVVDNAISNKHWKVTRYLLEKGVPLSTSYAFLTEGRANSLLNALCGDEPTISVSKKHLENLLSVVKPVPTPCVYEAPGPTPNTNVIPLPTQTFPTTQPQRQIPPTDHAPIGLQWFHQQDRSSLPSARSAVASHINSASSSINSVVAPVPMYNTSPTPAELLARYRSTPPQGNRQVISGETSSFRRPQKKQKKSHETSATGQQPANSNAPMAQSATSTPMEIDQMPVLESHATSIKQETSTSTPASGRPLP